MDHLWKAIDDIIASMLRNGDAMMWVAMTTRQDASIYGHGIRAAVHLVALGKHLGLAKFNLMQVAVAGALLDIGKTTLPLRLLIKPEKLSEEEFVMVRGHVNNGLSMITGTAPLHDEIIRAIAEHHEREDGSGYPKGLQGDQIGLYGRMAAIVDTFIALTDERPFAQAISPYLAFRKITEWSKSLFFAPLVEQYIQAIGVFPVGSLVRLSSGEMAVVVRQNRAKRLQPLVLIVADADKSPKCKPRHLDLAEQTLKRNAPLAVTISDGLPASAFELDERLVRLG